MIKNTNSILGKVASKIPDKLKLKKKDAAVEPQDKVEISDGSQENQEKRPLSSATGRSIRKTISNLSGLANGLASMALNVPLGFTQGVSRALHPDRDMATRKRLLAKYSTINASVIGGAVGALTFGPVGMIVGATTGYVGSVIGDYMHNKSGGMETFVNKVDNAVDKTIEKLPKKEKSTRFRKVLNAGFTGIKEGVKEGWKSGWFVGQSSGAGVVGAAKFIADDVKETRKAQKAKTVDKAKPKTEEEHSLIGKAFRTAMGVVCGISGVLMNVPGGIVEGSLEAIEVGFHRKDMTKPLLLFATNTGKVLPPAIVGAAMGGPVGAAVGTAVGLVTGSLTTSIDGKYGFNRGIIRRIDKAIGEAVEEGTPKGHAIYHNASKGAIVGAYAGLKEGWELGYKGGVEFADGLFETPMEAAKHEEEPEVKVPKEQMQFDFMKKKPEEAKSDKK